VKPYSPFAAKGYIRRCTKGHTFSTLDGASRYLNKKANPRYLCPECCKVPGFRLPRGWSKA